MKTHRIKIENKYLDTYSPGNVDLKKFSDLLRLNGYKVEKVWLDLRHAVGLLHKDGHKLIAILSTTEGMSWATRTEYEWNDQFNRQVKKSESTFLVPVNHDWGYFNNLFYLITDFSDGKLLFDEFKNNFNRKIFNYDLDKILDFSELIQSLNFKGMDIDEQYGNMDHQQRFFEKTKQMYEETPSDIKIKYNLKELLEFVENKSNLLEKRLNHGDFDPRHIFKTLDKKYYLIDAELADPKGIEYLDIAYFFQVIYREIKNEKVVEDFIYKFKERKYDFEKLQVVLVSRVIGSFRRRSLMKETNYERDVDFKNLVLNL